MPPRSALSREAIWAVLSSLSAVACDKDVPTAEPPVAPAAASASAAHAAASPSETKAAAAAPAASGVGAQEVKPATGKAGEKEKTCSPGGCAPGMCGANKH